LINACKDHRHLESFSSRTTLTRPMWERIAARWSEFGLPGQAPELLAYDADAGAVRYHEASELGGGEAPTR
jgi:4-hydroxy-3-polyprenylbenzoate decarboxylase